VYVSFSTAANRIVIIAVACGVNTDRENTDTLTGAEVPHGLLFAVQFILISCPHLLDFQSDSFSRQFLLALGLNILIMCPDCRMPTTKISVVIPKGSGPNRCWVRHDVSQGCLSLIRYFAVWCDYVQIVACSRIVVIILVCVVLSWFVERCFSSAAYVGLCNTVIATCLPFISSAQLATMHMLACAMQSLLLVFP